MGWGKGTFPFHLSRFKHLTSKCLVGSLAYVSPKFLIFCLCSFDNLSCRHVLNPFHFCLYRKEKHMWQWKKWRQVLGPQELISLTRMWRKTRAVGQADWAVMSLPAPHCEVTHDGLEKSLLITLYQDLATVFGLNAVWCCSQNWQKIKAMFG